jgi:hypothetical protein
MAAHCLLSGFDVGAMSVIENNACCGVLAAIAGSGNAENTRMNVTAPKSAPFAEPFIAEESIFEPIFLVQTI